MKFLGGGGKLDLGGGYPRAPPPLYETLNSMFTSYNVSGAYSVRVRVCSE